MTHRAIPKEGRQGKQTGRSTGGWRRTTDYTDCTDGDRSVGRCLGGGETALNSRPFHRSPTRKTRFCRRQQETGSGVAASASEQGSRRRIHSLALAATGRCAKRAAAIGPQGFLFWPRLSKVLLIEFRSGLMTDVSPLRPRRFRRAQRGRSKVLLHSNRPPPQINDPHHETVTLLVQVSRPRINRVASAPGRSRLRFASARSGGAHRQASERAYVLYPKEREADRKSVV